MRTVLLNKLQPAALALAFVPVLSCPVWAPTVVAAQDQSAQRSDGQIEMDVVQALDDSQALKNDLITAATIQGKVTLSGTVASQANKDLAQSIVAKVQGVAGVVNNLKVGNPADAAQADNLPAPEDDQQPADNSQQAQQPNQPGYPQQQQPDQNYPQQPNAAPAPNYPQQQPGYPQQGGNYPPPPPRPQYAPGYGPGYPPPPQGYGQQQPYPAAPSFAIPTSPITLAAGTVLQLRTTDNVDSKKATPGTTLDFMVIRDIAVNGYLAIPRGATIHGVVTEVKQSGQLAGSSELGLKLVSLDLGGRQYPLDSDVFKVKSPNKANRTVGSAIGGALLGAIIGGAAGGGGGAAIGAAAGGTVGTAASAASPNPRAWIPAEALVVFHLNTPITLDPVTQQEAARLAQGLYPGGPNLYRRGYGPGPGYYAYPAPYGYPPVYYRPYYIVGGAYYWR
jgi:hypothetical protein